MKRHAVLFAILPSLVWGATLFSPLNFAETKAQDAEKIGVRPYEMDWAGRTEEVGPVLVDFENLDGWTVSTENAVATFERSREEQMYGKYVGKLTYRADGTANAPVVEIRAPEPLPISPGDFDAFSVWIVGNNWGWTVDPKTPRVRLSAIFRKADGSETTLPFATVNWREWFLRYQVLTADWQKTLKNAAFCGFRVENGTNAENRTLYFDSLCFFKETKEPLEFTPRPKPGIDLFPGQPLGINSGEGRLPFPTRPETILPDSAKNLRKPAFHKYDDGFDFVYEGTDGTLVYEYRPKNGDFSDITARWNGSAPFKPLVGGGITMLVGESGGEELLDKVELLETKIDENGGASPTVVTRWKLTTKTASAEVEYRIAASGKNLIADVIALGGKIATVSFGRIEGVETPKTISIPYYMYDYGKRPGVALFQVSGKGAKAAEKTSLFASGHIDWYRTGASYHLGKHEIGTTGISAQPDGSGGKFARVNGAAQYRLKTDGTRNDVYERFIFTVSPKFEETLPTIPNPPSPYKHIAGKGVWRAHGATTRDGDKAYWRDVWRRGMRNLIITDHEVCWRDGGESFTFRTEPAPKKGGDDGWRDYARFMIDELGFVYGPYNNFTDFAPVNGNWSPDMVGRFSDGTLQPAWMRCYAPKPTRAVEFCEKLTPIIQEKFQFNCAYCDVHSSVPIGSRTDYDARVPGAGTMQSVFYPFGEIFLLQKKNWKGPTYSEGPHHVFYAGLTDGNYAQDQPYDLRVSPWLVDFDLLKMHDLQCDFGLGNLGMFGPGYSPQTPQERETLLDRFLCGTLAFGHAGFLVLDYGIESGAKSYFAIQQIASRYTQTSVESIRYFDENGEKLETSAALIADAVRINQLEVRYQDGTTVVANGSNTKNLVVKNASGRKIVLPPNGYAAWTADGEIYVESALSENGARFDLSVSPEYVYFDGRENWTNRDRACGSACGVLRTLVGDEKTDAAAPQFELIPYRGSTLDLGFKIGDGSNAVSAMALDFDGKELGAATVRYSRGYVFVEPFDGAVSYRLTQTTLPAPILDGETTARFYVAPGETLSVGGAKLTVPADAKSGTRVWSDANPARDGAFADFCVAEPLDVDFAFDSKTNVLTATATTRLDGARIETAATLKLGEKTVFESSATLEKGTPKTFEIPLENPTEEGAETATLQTVATLPDGQTATRDFSLDFKTASKFVPFAELQFDAPLTKQTENVERTFYVQRRGGEPTTQFEGTGSSASYQNDIVCGADEKPGYFVHPPYLGGPGRAFWRFDFDVPNEPSAFRVSVGKRNGSDVGDGVLFQIAVAEFGAKNKIASEKTLAETTVRGHYWAPLEADLSEYAGKRVSLLVSSDPGAKNDTSGDWGAFAEPRLESARQTLVRELK